MHTVTYWCILTYIQTDKIDAISLLPKNSIIWTNLGSKGTKLKGESRTKIIDQMSTKKPIRCLQLSADCCSFLELATKQQLSFQ